MTRPRDRALDLLRALAIGRVFLWHATGWSLLTWIGALPVMFFVTGHLFAAGADRNGLRRTLADRGRRLLLPYWFFGGSMLVVMYAVSGGTWPAEASDLVGWILPVVNPVGAPWQAGWITEPLWYLRTYTWLLILAAPLLWALRRRPLLLLSGSAVLVVVTELAFGVRYWALQDALLYGLFFALGAANARRDSVPNRSRLLVGAAAAAALCFVWVLFRSPLDGVVNNSHTAHMLVGGVWLALAVAFLSELRRVAASPAVGRVVDRITSRSLSIYLWHAPLLGLGYVLLARTPLNVMVLTVAGTVLGLLLTVLVTSLVAGIERFGGRRAGTGPSVRSVLLPTARAGVLGVLSAAAVAGVLVVGEPRTVALPPTPSKAPEQVDLTENEALAFLLEPPTTSGEQTPAVPDTTGDSYFTSNPIPVDTTTGTAPRKPGRRGTPTTTPVTTPGTPPGSVPVTTPTTLPVSGPVVPRATRPVADWSDIAPEAADDIRAAIVATAGEWVRKQKTDRQTTYETGLEIVILQPGRLRIATTIDKNGEAAPVGESIPFASITKSFTAALLLRAVEEGRIDMDAPIGRLAVAPWFTLTDGLSLRNLLAHRSGIVTYTSTGTWARDWQLIDGWEPVLRAAEDEGRSFTIGSKVEYASTNYVIAGLLAAQVYGMPIEKLIQEHLLEPLGLRRTRVGQPTPGSPGTGTGNMSGHVTDLARWAVAMWRDKTVLGSTGNSLASYTDPVQLIGYGGFSYCPCRTERGRLVVAGIGANGAEATVRWYPATDTIIAIRIPNGLVPPLEDLITALLTITR
jgi:CubicO group peptidase (beta-lactamase class C family)/peptidoglycan/LPS O-acetylase OafA/YrhL